MPSFRSVSGRGLRKSILPFNTFLDVTYTQKSFWDIYRTSLPFPDNNFNPGLSIGKLIIRNNQLKKIAIFSFEHESNGRDSIDSRDWNYFSFFLPISLRCVSVPKLKPGRAG